MGTHIFSATICLWFVYEIYRSPTNLFLLADYNFVELKKNTDQGETGETGSVDVDLLVYTLVVVV